MYRPFALMMLVAGGGAFRVPKKRNASISIVNGRNATECEWIHQVGISDTVDEEPWCGGSLITSEWVLTAGHCTDDILGRLNVIAGEWSTIHASGNEQRRWTSEIHKHTNYNFPFHDLALLKLETPMNLSSSCVGTVRLPSKDVSPGTMCWSTGWGRLKNSDWDAYPTTLQEANLTVISNSDCIDEYGYKSGEITNDMLCAQSKTAQGDIIGNCQGDSGGPFVCNEGGSWVLHGVNSWVGEGCAFSRFPSVMSRVFNQLKWINSIVYPDGLTRRRRRRRAAASSAAQAAEAASSAIEAEEDGEAMQEVDVEHKLNDVP